jgi:hypothetical protein
MKSTDIQFPGSPFEPRNYKEAMRCDKAHLWDPSMVNEFNSHQINNAMSPNTEWERKAITKIPYRSTIGSLLYLATVSRPDLSLIAG